jgi:aminopeptidase C
VTSLLQLGQMALLNGAIVLTSIRAWQKGQIIRWTGSNSIWMGSDMAKRGFLILSADLRTI